MKALLLAGVVLAAGCLPLSAADFSGADETVAAVPDFDWNGLYFGVNGGGGWGEIDWAFVNGPSATWDSGGGIAGATIGYNFQSGPWLLGVEGDFDWADISGSIDCPNPAFSCQSDLDWFATFRGRAGWATGRLLLFGTAGLAVADMHVETVLPGNSVPPSGKPVNGSSATAVGWTAGLGAEFAFWSNWSGKIEWLYYDLGTNSYTVDFNSKVRASQNGNMVRIGLNRKFN